MIELASGTGVAPNAHQVSVVDHRLVEWDLERKMSRKDRLLKTVGRHRTAVVGSPENKMLVENRSGSYRTAKEAS